MHWADIKAAIYKAGSTPMAIARQEGVSHTAVNQVIRGEITSHPLAYAIAAITGIPTERMWPGRYLTPPAYQQAAARRCGERGRLPRAAS